MNNSYGGDGSSLAEGSVNTAYSLNSAGTPPQGACLEYVCVYVYGSILFIRVYMCIYMFTV
jgi:hypothetical protein